ncbi:MAG: peptidoglycan DD-metalloendopeptidase family protein [Gemmatimonadales bacterium]
MKSVVCSLALLLLAPTLGAQAGVDQQIRRNQARLDSIRMERAEWENQLNRLRGRERSITSELTNIERQRLATTRLMTELDRQRHELNAQLDTITTDLLVAEDALSEKRATQQARIVEIYKRGRLWGVQVLLSAESFADLLSRYKYLYLVSRRDQALVTEVEELRDRIAAERRNLALVQRELDTNRGAREQELNRYRQLERDRQRTLGQTRTSAERAQAQLSALAAAEAEVNDLLAELERRRREALASGRATLTPTISGDSRGRLPWPAEGPLAYRFGPAPGPTGTTIRYLGIGIRVSPGTAVQSVAEGRVIVAGPFGTFGPSVMIEHGGGYYTLYLYLSSVSVTPDQMVVQGQPIGRSGGQATEEGPHIEFQIRQTIGQGQPQAVNPLDWLVRRP